MQSLRVRQIVWLIVAAGLLVAGGMLQPSLDRLGGEHDLYIASAGQVDMATIRLLPGGLRALAFNYVWMRSQQQHQAGRHYDARQLASLACQLMPSFPGVWAFHAWNMAWNISVTTHTNEERWHWVHQGLTLLRDEAIPHNRKALLLYKELGWIFFFKMGQSLDDMHVYYKRRWAAEMQRLLGAPGFGTTEEVIAAFRPIAEAPLDKTITRQGEWDIQPGQRDKLLEGPAVMAYAELLADRDVHIDASLLAAYNRFSLDSSVASVRAAPPKLSLREDRDLSELINDPKHAVARGKMLAFVRAQMLWNRYKMDPQWMLGLMERYNAPFDWRIVWPHGLYWITYGIHITEAKGLDDITTINTERIAMFCLRMLIWGGRLVYLANPEDPDAPRLRYLSDFRYVMPTQDEYVRSVEDLIAMSGRQDDPRAFQDNIFRNGHISFLKDVIPMLYVGYRRSEAQKLYDWLRDTYKPAGPEWAVEDVEEFVIFELNQPGKLTPDVARSQVNAAVMAALTHLATERRAAFRQSYDYALNTVYRTYQQRAKENIQLARFELIVADRVRELLVRPQIVGVDLSLAERSRLYDEIENVLPGLQAAIYDSIVPNLRPECERHGYDFDRAFPRPSKLNQPAQESSVQKGR